MAKMCCVQISILVEPNFAIARSEFHHDQQHWAAAQIFV